MLFFQLLFLFCATFGTPAWASAHPADVYFSPDHPLERRLIEQIEQEKKSIHACVYAFTHRRVVSALIDAKKRGVDVEVIVDRFSIKAKSPLYRLVDAGIPVYVWNPNPERKKGHRSLMHHKFCIFGSDKVWTGSFNWTYEACRIHQENAIILHDPGLAASYEGQFYAVKLRSCLPFASYVATHPKKYKGIAKRSLK